MMQKLRILLLVLLVGYLAVLAYGAFSDHVPDIEKLSKFDKVIHAGEFFLLALILFFTMRSFGLSVEFSGISAFIMSISLGLLVEFGQLFFTATRDFSWFDFIADSIGIILAVIVAVVTDWIYSKR